MQPVSMFVLASALLGAASAGVAADHPVTSVITMLEKLSAKAEEEGKEEALAYEKFEYWCKNSKKELSTAIQGEKEKISSLESSIKGLTQEKKTLTKQIGKLDDELDELEKSGAKAKRACQKEENLYKKEIKSYDETISAIKDAIAALEDAEGATSFAQAMSRPSVVGTLSMVQAFASESQRRTIAALLQQQEARPEQLAEGDRAAHVQQYDSKVGKVIEMLKELSLDFQDKHSEATKEQTNNQNACALAEQARKEQVARASDSRDKKDGIRTDVKDELNQADSDLKSERKALQEDSDTLADTDKACSIKASEWETRSSVRESEREAIKAAIEILQKVTDVRTEKPTNPVPPPSPVEGGASFLQIVDPSAKAIALLRSKARETHSRALERFAQELSLHRDSPFDVVNNKIQKMIFRLEQEQKDEDDHKNWCDKELSENEAAYDNKEEKIDDLSARIDADDATAKQLAAEIGEANEMIEDINKFMKEATEVRNIGKKENAKAIKDAQEAQDAIAKATAVLTDFYKKSGKVAEASEFLQGASSGVDLPEKPSTWGGSYTGVADPKAQPEGIITILEETSAKFAAMEADTRSEENSDQAAYEEDVSANKIEKAGREGEIKTKEAEKRRLTEKIQQLTKTRKNVQEEQIAVKQYLKDLEPACKEGDSTYKERKAARAQEADALRQAQQILANAFNEREGGGGRMCCKAMTAKCLSCTKDQTVKEYCQDNPKTAGCKGASFLGARLGL